MAVDLNTGQTIWTALSANTDGPNSDPTVTDARRGWGVVKNLVWWSHTDTGGHIWHRE